MPSSFNLRLNRHDTPIHHQNHAVPTMHTDRRSVLTKLSFTQTTAVIIERILTQPIECAMSRRQPANQVLHPAVQLFVSVTYLPNPLQKPSTIAGHAQFQAIPQPFILALQLPSRPLTTPYTRFNLQLANKATLDIQMLATGPVSLKSH